MSHDYRYVWTYIYHLTIFYLTYPDFLFLHFAFYYFIIVHLFSLY